MPNDVTKSPYIIDTVNASQIVAGRIRIVGIRWVGATTQSHTATITDGTSAARVVWTDRALQATMNVSESRIPIDLREGFAVPTLSSGTLYIYVQPAPAL